MFGTSTKKYGLLLLFCCLFVATGNGQSVKRIVIDAGHGGKDPGCLGKYSKEKDVAFDIAMQLGELIRLYLPDVAVIYTRKSKDEFLELRERTNIANQNHADLFISVHCNAHRVRSIDGSETYVLGVERNEENLQVSMRENAVILDEKDYERNYDGYDPGSPMSYILMANQQNNYQAYSILLAGKIEEQFCAYTGRISRGVKQAGFWVLAKNTMPSVLVEVGFLTNEKEEQFFATEIGKAQVAACLYRAVRDYKAELEGKQTGN